MEWINDLKRRMRPYFGSYCGAINCGTNQKYYSDISLFRFPKDAERSKRWLINTRRADLMKKDTQYLYNNIKICALHFEDSQFMNSEKKRLVWNAVPTLFDVPNKPPTITLKRKLPNRCTVPPKKKHKARRSLDVGVGGESATAARENTSVKDEPADNRESTSATAEEARENTSVKDEPADDNRESTSATAEEVCSGISLKMHQQPEHEELSCEEHKPQVCDRITVKVEPDPEYEGNSSEEYITQETEYIEVKGEPLEEEEATDADGTRRDALSAW